jgi:hypothetical protein
VNIAYTAYYAGYLALPIGAGIIMLIIGYSRRRASQPKVVPPPPNPYAQLPHYYRPPGAAPRHRRGTGLIVAGAVLVAVTALGAVGRAATASDGASSSGRIHVGDCVSAQNLKRSGAWKPIDCADPQANFELAAVSGSAQCPDKPIRDTAYVYLSTSSSTMCFIPVLAQGACFRADSLQTVFNVVPCADRPAGAKVAKVAKRIDGSTDATLCATATKPLAYPKPARVYCVAAVTNT